jgi:hypothetical protein
MQVSSPLHGPSALRLREITFRYPYSVWTFERKIFCLYTELNPDFSLVQTKNYENDLSHFHLDTTAHTPLTVNRPAFYLFVYYFASLSVTTELNSINTMPIAACSYYICKINLSAMNSIIQH